MKIIVVFEGKEDESLVVWVMKAMLELRCKVKIFMTSTHQGKRGWEMAAFASIEEENELLD